jgi:hypothetical protein
MIKQVAEQILRILNGGDYNVADSKWDIREIELLVGQVTSKLVTKSIYEKYLLGERDSFGQYLTTFFGVPVKKYESRNLFYIDIPAKYISLPRNGGVNSIGPEANEFVKYIPCEVGILNMYGTRDVPFLQGNVGYWLEGMKAYFTREVVGPLVVKLHTTSDIEANVPEEMQADVILACLQILQGAKPEDKLNDANANEMTQGGEK